MIPRPIAVACSLLLAVAGAPADDRVEAERAVRAALAVQVEAWNRGDLESFTSIYAEDAVFVTPDRVTRGRALVLERYRARYPDGTAMGKLTLEILETLPLGAVRQDVEGGQPGRVQGVTVTARWILEFAEGADPPRAEGYTLIVFRPRGNGWEIVRDASM